MKKRKVATRDIRDDLANLLGTLNRMASSNNTVDDINKYGKHKLSDLLRSWTDEPPAGEPDPAFITRLVELDSQILAIAEIRKRLGYGLAEAKAYYDAHVQPHRS